VGVGITIGKEASWMLSVGSEKSEWRYGNLRNGEGGDKLQHCNK